MSSLREISGKGRICSISGSWGRSCVFLVITASIVKKPLLNFNTPMSRSTLLLLLLVLLNSTMSHAQADGVWVFDDTDTRAVSSSGFSDGSFCLQLDDRKFVLTNANDRIIAQNAGQWTYLEGRFKRKGSILLLKVKRQFYFSTNIGRVVRELSRRDIQHRELELMVDVEADGNLSILPLDFFPFGSFSACTLSKGEKMPYYPYRSNTK